MEESLFLQGGKEPFMELLQRSKAAPLHRASLHIGFRIQKISIHQTGIQHPQPEPAANEIHLPLALEIRDCLFDSLDGFGSLQFLLPGRAIRNFFLHPRRKRILSRQIRR